MKNRIYILFALFGIHLLSLAQDVSVRALLDTNKGLIGDQFRLRLLVEKPSGSWKVSFPVLHDSISGSIEVLESKPVDTSESNTEQILTQEFLITVFDTGFFEIPALPFTVSNAGFSDTIRSVPVFFEIRAMKADSTIRDIKEIYRVPVSFRELIPYILGIVVIGILVWILIWYVKHRRLSIPGSKIEIPSEPAEVIAMRELARLREEKPWLNNRIKYYYIRLSDIIRIYIEHRFQIPAMEQITSEIVLALKNRNQDGRELTKLSELLKLADLVKFAKVIPDPEQNALQIDMAEEFVRNTSVVVVKTTGEELVESNTR